PPDVKEDDESEIQAEDQKPTDDSSKDSDKDSIKQDSAKEESGKEESGKDESEDENEEVGLLDRPVEVTGCRARKKVERLEISFATSKEKQEIPVGKGQKLGECPRIEFQIQRNKLPDLKPLHKILFNRVGSGNEIKKNIRKFCGFTFEKNSQEYERKKAVVEKLTAAILKHVCEVLDLERSGTKEEIVLRILEFLLNPKDSGKKVPSKKKLSSGHEKRKSKEKKSKNSEKKVKTKKEVSDDDDDDDEEPESPDSAADVSEDASEEDVDDSDDEPKKKSKNTSKTKETSGKGKAKKNEKVANKIKKEEKRTVGKGSKRKHDDDSDASSEDEPIQKKSKMPTDDDIKTLVRQILDEADLQEITMKKVIKQVSDAYPDCDLSHKKAFIKTTIKSVIS
ncbi:protein DEK-like, partial [Stegodyphus dumicola]|uniref:protein DEK-like n=1 Tax=Stegodyphus dumicola TaxID=202533 RepID=UPI0015B04E3F